MLSTLAHKVKDASVLRRICFATTFLPKSMPNYWECIASFSVLHKKSRNDMTVDQVSGGFRGGSLGS